MRKALLALLGLSVLVDLVLGSWASAFWDNYVNTWLPELRLLADAQADDVRLLGLVLGLCLLCYAAIQILAVVWIRADKEEGLTLALVFGGYLIVSSVITFLVFQGRIEFLLVDGLRGALITVFAVVLRNEPSTIRVLRLPDGRRRAVRDERRPATQRERPARRRTTPRSSESEGQRRDRTATRKPGESTREQGESRPDRTRRRRPVRRDEQASPPEAEGGRTHLRPVVTSKPVKQRERPASGTASDTEAQGRRGSFDSRATETTSDSDSARRMVNRSRTTEELLAEDVASYRRRSSSGGDNPLAVVVRGDLDAPRTPPMTGGTLRNGSDRDSGTRSSSEEEAPDTGRKRRRRRRRPRSQEGGPVEQDREEDNGGIATKDDARPVSEEESEDRQRDAGREGPAITEALDVLSMLEPTDDDLDDDGPAFGRSRRPDRRRGGRRR